MKTRINELTKLVKGKSILHCVCGSRGPKGEKLTDEVINAYKEQDELDKESVFDQCAKDENI